jgi:hypothetical protein
MIEEITYEDILPNDLISASENRNSLQRRFITKLIQLRNVYLFNEMIIPMRIGTILQDTSMYYNSGNLNTTFTSTSPTKPYPFGSLAGINVLIDPMLSWNNNRIIISEDKLLLRKIKIDKILNKRNNIKHLEEIIIDEKILNMLL